MKDFTLGIYKKLVETLQTQNYHFITVEEYFSPSHSLASSSNRPVVPSSSRPVSQSQSHPLSKSPSHSLVILRHDVDRKPHNALKMAELEASFGIKSSYYFRFVPESYNEKIIKQIAELGHEIGYHYENLSQLNGNYKKALIDFKNNLNTLREFYPVKTICMHGSPMSKWDNRELWKKYDYRKYGIICEPYFDLDFNKVFYITDASRAWNNEKVSVRDKVESNFDIPINTTQNIINLLEFDNAPKQIMISIHPHNWSKTNVEWWKIYLWQSFKNIVKRIMIQIHKKDEKNK